jgi:hypothetical protein
MMWRMATMVALLMTVLVAGVAAAQYGNQPGVGQDQEMGQQPYGQFPGQEPLEQEREFNATDPYGRDQPMGGQQPYGQDSGIGQQPYGHDQPMGGQQPYGQQPYEQDSGIGQDQPMGGQQPYGQDSGLGTGSGSQSPGQ